MKKLSVFMVLFFLIGISNATELVTAQAPDKIIFKGKEYNLNSNPLESFFEEHPEKRPEGNIMSTGLWRGYIAHFEIINDSLFVTDIKIQVHDKESDDSFPYKWVSAYQKVFPNTTKTKIDWFNGILILPFGDRVEYVHMGYGSTYSKYWLLELEKGKMNEARRFNNKTFIEFKKRQLKEFKKTDEYKKLYKELKESDSWNEKMITDFLSNFIINYTSKFLTE